MLPERLSRAPHDEEASVLERDRNRVPVLLLVSKREFPLGAEAKRANCGILPKCLFVVAVPAHSFTAVVVQVAQTRIERALGFIFNKRLKSE